MIQLFQQCTYNEGLTLQSTYYEKVKNSSEETLALLGFEHPRTITFGKRAQPEDSLAESPQQLSQKGYALVQTDRGGQCTLHNSGQLVIYPIVNFLRLGLKPKTWVHFVEQQTKDWLEELVDAPILHGSSDPGLFTPQGKVAFFGFRLRQGISTHGIALNIANDLDDFDQIRSCGQPLGARHDHLKPHLVIGSSHWNLEDFFNSWCDHFLNAIPLTKYKPTDKVTTISL